MNHSSNVRNVHRGVSMKMEIYDATNRIDRPAISVTWISLLTEDEEWLSGLGLREFQMRFGAAHLKMGH